MVTNAKDVLDYYRSHCNFSSTLQKRVSEISSPYSSLRSSPRPNPKISGNSFSPLEQKIFEHLRREPCELDILARTFGVSASALGTALSLMQLSGIISEESGTYYAH